MFTTRARWRLDVWCRGKAQVCALDCHTKDLYFTQTAVIFIVQHKDDGTIGMPSRLRQPPLRLDGAGGVAKDEDE